MQTRRQQSSNKTAGHQSVTLPGLNGPSREGAANPVSSSRGTLTTPKQVSVIHRRGNGSVGARMQTNKKSDETAVAAVKQVFEHQRPQLATRVHPQNPIEISRQVISPRDNSPSLVNLLYMEDFDPEVDPEFIKRDLRPYLSSVFADLTIRST